MAGIVTFPQHSWETIRFRAEQVGVGAERYLYSAFRLGDSVVSAYMDNGVLETKTHLAIVSLSTADITEVVDITSESVRQCGRKQPVEQTPLSEEEKAVRTLLGGLMQETVKITLDDTDSNGLMANASVMDASPSSFMCWCLGVRALYDKTILDQDKGMFVTNAIKSSDARLNMRRMQLDED